MNIQIAKSDVKNQIVYGVVYEPNDIDTDGETMDVKAVQQACWSFMSKKDAFLIDIQHNLEKSGCYVVENFIAREGDPDFKVGSWVMGVKCPDDVWKQVLAGELNGFSLYGQTLKSPRRVLVSVAKQLVGTTEESTIDIFPPHSHAFIVNLDVDGHIVSGRTDTVFEHNHLIKYGTATETNVDHNHRISLDVDADSGIEELL
jgi:hypothetical protein